MKQRISDEKLDHYIHLCKVAVQFEAWEHSNRDSLAICTELKELRAELAKLKEEYAHDMHATNLRGWDEGYRDGLRGVMNK